MDIDQPAAHAGRRLLRPKILAGTAALAAVVAIAAGTQSQAPLQPADAATAAATPAADFGTAIPSDRFVHEFQKEVVQQLQSTLTQAGREQDERLQRFEQQAQELRLQSDALARSVQQLQSRGEPAEGEAPDQAPRVNARSAPRADTGADAAAPASAAPASQANLSPHGFAEGRLLNGVVAIVGGPERESIVALHGEYEAANGFTTDLDGCFALVQGRPELPAGRIDFKVARLTCNFPDGASKTWDVAGWLVDPDGIRGVRARIVQNAGRKALVATAGGALAGFGRRLSTEQYQVNAGPLASSSTFIGNAAHDTLGGSAEGAAGALGQSIADYYNLYAPSLQVGGGTQVSLVIANELKFPASGRNSTQTHTSP
jgi:conjugal transfer pilus assembly protein TraB